jgi:predicted nucleotidyltransferase
MMSQRDCEVLETFARRVRERYPQARIWAFGSRARGDAGAASDFDVCVVLEQKSAADEALLQHIAWEVAFDNGLVFNTLVFTSDELENGPMSESTLKKNILREGIPV